MLLLNFHPIIIAKKHKILIMTSKYHMFKLYSTLSLIYT